MSDFELKEAQDESNDSRENELEERKESNDGDEIKPSKKSKKPLKERIKDFFADPKKRLLFIISVGVIIIGAAGFGLYSLSHEKNILGGDKKEEEKANEPKYPAILDGVMTDQTSANRHPLAVIVENHPDSRPQSGLDKASVIFEAIAEGGITRFLAIFGTNEAEKVGPVRSARTYFVDWAHGFDAYLAHVGGNIDALEKIPQDKIMDLDQFRFSAPYWREKNRNIATEHTMYTSTVKLREQAEKNKYSTANNFTTYRFKDEPTQDQLATATDQQKLAVNISTAQFNVDFVYDKATNSYKRNMAGSAHTDAVTKNQLNPKNIVVMTVKRKAITTRINEAGYEMTTNGTGTAKIFLDGKEITGTWKKNSNEDQTLFYDEKGTEIVFNRGQIWITVIPPEGSVSVK